MDSNKLARPIEECMGVSMEWLIFAIRLGTTKKKK